MTLTPTQRPTSMTNELHPGEVLTAETVGLLEAGDLLRCVAGSPAADIKAGTVCTFLNESDTGGVSRCIVTSADPGFGFKPTRFEWIGRPNAEGWIDAPEGGWKTDPGLSGEVRLRDGHIGPVHSSLRWNHEGNSTDIVAIRLSASDEVRGSLPAAPSVPTEPFIAVRGQFFSSEQDWINTATRRLTGHPQYRNTEHGESKGWRGEHFTALCFDQAGRRLRNGGDFKRATEDGSYPVWWIWPDQINDHLRSRAEAHPQEAASVPGEDGPAGQWQDIATMLAEVFGGSLTAFPFDTDEGDDEEVEATLTRRQIKALCGFAGVDPVTGDAAPTKEPA